MKTSAVIIALAVSLSVHAQEKTLFDNPDLKPLNVLTSETTYRGKQALKVTGNGDRTAAPKLVLLENTHFRNGTIEIEMAGQPAKDAGGNARGFVGIAFRIGEDPNEYECIYLRPANGRAEDQVRRNHSVQYISHPDFTWSRLRSEFPGKYESYVDLQVGAWTPVKIVVEGSTARLYVHGNEQPTLIVSDLRRGPDAGGRIGLWIEESTVAHFTGMTISNK